MALTGTDRGTGNHNTGATSVTITFPQAMSLGSMGVLKIALDNAGSAGATAAAPASATDSKGNTWTRRQDAIYDNGAASAGVEVAIYTSNLRAAVTTSDTVVLTWIAGVSVTAKAWAFDEVTAGAGKFPSYVTGAAGVGATSGTPTVTTSSITSGQMVIGAGGVESADTWAGDADTTNGNWSTHQHNVAGTGATGMAVTSQRKVTTATATQTYNPTCTSADTDLAWISIQELNAYSLTAAVGTFTETGNAANLLRGWLLGAAVGTFTETGNAANLLRGRLLSAAVGSFVETGNAVTFSRGKIMVADPGTFVETGNDATLTVGGGFGAYTLSASTGSFALSGQSTNLLAARVLQAQAGSFTETGNPAALLAGRRLNTSVGGFALTGSNAGFVYSGAGNHILHAAVGSFVLTGNPATLIHTVTQPSTIGALSTSLVNSGITSVAALTGTNSTSLVNNGVTST